MRCGYSLEYIWMTNVEDSTLMIAHLYFSMKAQYSFSEIQLDMCI